MLLVGLHGLVGSGTADGVVGEVSLVAFAVNLLVVAGILVIVA